jgi:hypothetical protein
METARIQCQHWPMGHVNDNDVNASPLTITYSTEF